MTAEPKHDDKATTAESHHDDDTHIIAQLARVTYVDLAQHTNQNTASFFKSAGLKTLQIYGFTARVGDLVKVMFCIDSTDDSDGEGLVIPASCVVEIKALDPIDPESLN